MKENLWAPLPAIHLIATVAIGTVVLADREHVVEGMSEGMQALSLSKGGHAALEPGAVSLQVAARGTPLDVSALLLGANGKVRSDNDLVFYNHPAQDGVSLAAETVTADLRRIPAAVATVVIVASVDPSHPGTVFTAAPALTVIQGSAASMTFTPPDFTSGETVVVLAEIYRRSGGWKVRAVGQGYASGLVHLFDLGLRK